MQAYRSIHHPGHTSRLLLYGQWLVRPLAMCSLPIMILTLVDVLQGRSILPYLFFGFPAALALASAWTGFRMRSAAAEIAIDGPYAEVRTVLDVLSRRPPNPWRMVLDVRKSEDHFQVAIGESVFELPDSDWPEVGQLVRALQTARGAPLPAEAPSAAGTSPGMSGA